MSKYQTSASMFIDRFSGQVTSPDSRLIAQLHALLDMLPEQQALAIDHTVAELLRFHNPNRQHMPEIMP